MQVNDRGFSFFCTDCTTKGVSAQKNTFIVNILRSTIMFYEHTRQEDVVKSSDPSYYNQTLNNYSSVSNY